MWKQQFRACQKKCGGVSYTFDSHILILPALGPLSSTHTPSLTLRPSLPPTALLGNAHICGCGTQGSGQKGAEAKSNLYAKRPLLGTLDTGTSRRWLPTTTSRSTATTPAAVGAAWTAPRPAAITAAPTVWLRNKKAFMSRLLPPPSRPSLLRLSAVDAAAARPCGM